MEDENYLQFIKKEIVISVVNILLIFKLGKKWKGTVLADCDRDSSYHLIGDTVDTYM